MEKLPLIVANWKMNKTIEETVSFIQDLAPQITEYNKKIYIAVPFTSLNEASKASENTKVVIGAQNMNDAKKGAFTGEIASLMLKEAGAEFVILGHSERRHIFNETDGFINKKILRAIKDDITPILCIGETEDEYNREKTQEVLEKQLKNCLKGVSKEDIEKVIIAYEPVWAIGSGKPATLEVIRDVHQFIKSVLKEIFDTSNVYLLYGGSVKPENIKALINEQDIDGVLVGGASLDPMIFLEIIKNS